MTNTLYKMRHPSEQRYCSNRSRRTEYANQSPVVGATLCEGRSNPIPRSASDPVAPAATRMNPRLENILFPLLLNDLIFGGRQHHIQRSLCFVSRARDSIRRVGRSLRQRRDIDPCRNVAAIELSSDVVLPAAFTNPRDPPA